MPNTEDLRYRDEETLGLPTDNPRLFGVDFDVSGARSTYHETVHYTAEHVGQMKGVVMNLNDLDPELREKALACKTSDELIKLAEETGITLTDEQLSSLSGAGAWGCTDN